MSQLQTSLKVLPTTWRRKPAGLDMDRNYVIIALCTAKYTCTRAQICKLPTQIYNIVTITYVYVLFLPKPNSMDSYRFFRF